MKRKKVAYRLALIMPFVLLSSVQAHSQSYTAIEHSSLNIETKYSVERRHLLSDNSNVDFNLDNISNGDLIAQIDYKNTYEINRLLKDNNSNPSSSYSYRKSINGKEFTVNGKVKIKKLDNQSFVFKDKIVNNKTVFVIEDEFDVFNNNNTYKYQNVHMIVEGKDGSIQFSVVYVNRKVGNLYAEYKFIDGDKQESISKKNTSAIEGLGGFDNTDLETFNISPNPARDNIDINYYTQDGNTTTFQITNSEGKVVKRFTSQLDNTNNNQKTSVSVSDLASGVYFVHMQTANNSINKILIIK